MRNTEIIYFAYFIDAGIFQVVGKICLPLQLNLESILRIHSIMLKDRCTLSEDVDLLVCTKCICQFMCIDSFTICN